MQNNKLETIIDLLSLQQEEGAFFCSESKFVLKKDEFITISISADKEENITAEIMYNQAIPEDMLEDVALRLCEKNSNIAMAGFSISDENKINKQYWYPASQDVLTVAYSLSMFFEDISHFAKIKKED